MATGPMSFERQQADGDSRLLRPAESTLVIHPPFMEQLANLPTVNMTTKVTLQDNPKLVDGGGYKASMDDPKKHPMWLVPVALIRGVAAVLGFGAKKYAANNWRRGMKYSEVYSALQRHLNAWIEGEDNDAESGLNHLWHAACCLAFLIEYIAFAKLYSQFDDRFKRPDA